MSYTLLNPQPGLRAEELDYDDHGPGLYNDETAIELDDGTPIAMSVETKWNENGGGVTFAGYARWINEDGSTHLTPLNQHIETNLNFNADATTVQKFGVNAIAKEIMLCMLGEEPTLVEHDELTPASPMIHWSPEFKLNVNIRYQIECASVVGPQAVNPGSVLGL